jgi:hypothetical protein
LFIFKVAAELGHTVEWIMNNMSYIELEAWAKYYEYLHKQAKAQQKK